MASEDPMEALIAQALTAAGVGFTRDLDGGNPSNLRHYVANAPMRRRLSALVLAAVIVCGVLGGCVPKASAAGFHIGQFDTPVIEAETSFPPLAKNIEIVNPSVVDDRDFLVADGLLVLLEKLLRNVAISEVLDPGAKRDVSIDADHAWIVERIKISRVRDCKLGKNNYLMSGSLARVFYADWGTPVFWLVAVGDPIRLGSKVGPQLRFGTSPILTQVFQKGDQGTTSKQRLDDHRPEHPIRKNRHRFLGGKVAMFALLGIAGFGFGYRALDMAVDARNVSKTIAWAVCWVGLTAIGGYGLVMSLIWAVH